MDELEQPDQLRSTRTAKRSGGVPGTVDTERMCQRHDELLKLSWESWYDAEDRHTIARAALQRAREKKRKLQDMESDGPQAQEASQSRQASPQAISNRHIQRAPTTPATTQQAELPIDDTFTSNAPSFAFHRASLDDTQSEGSLAMSRESLGFRQASKPNKHKTLWASWTDPTNVGTYYDACQSASSLERSAMYTDFFLQASPMVFELWLARTSPRTAKLVVGVSSGTCCVQAFIKRYPAVALRKHTAP